MRHMGAHQRTGSGGSLQDDRMLVRLGYEQPMSLLPPRDSPDFAMIYAFLGSMFDPVSAPPPPRGSKRLPKTAISSG